MAMPPAARIVVAAGATGLVLVVLNQATAPQLDPSLERAAVLGGLLAVGLLLVGLLWNRVQPEAPQRASLSGVEGLEMAEGLPQGLRHELGWGSMMLLTATPAAVLLLRWRDTTLLRRGLLGSEPFLPGPICRRAMERGKLISLVDLKLYPGRDEFDPLLAGLPAVVVQPVGGEGVLVLGGWSPRCFSRSDLAWIEGWAQRLTSEWVPVLDGADSCGEDHCPVEPEIR